MATSVHPDEDCQLRVANKKIADLKEVVRQLSDELKDKTALLTTTQNMAHEQCLRISSLTATLRDYGDTIHWDPSAWPLPSSSSTPASGSRQSWVEVVCGDKRAPVSATPTCLTLSNRFSVLSLDGNPNAGPADTVAPPMAIGSAPATHHSDDFGSRSRDAAAHSPPASDVLTVPCSDGSTSSTLAPAEVRSHHGVGLDNRIPSWTSTSASRRKLKEAVLQRSGGPISSSQAHGPLCRCTTCPNGHAAQSIHLPPLSYHIPVHVLFLLRPSCSSEIVLLKTSGFLMPPHSVFPGQQPPSYWTNFLSCYTQPLPPSTR